MRWQKGEMFGVLDRAEEKGVGVDLQEVVYTYAMSVFGELAYDVSWPRISFPCSQGSPTPD